MAPSTSPKKPLLGGCWRRTPIYVFLLFLGVGCQVTPQNENEGTSGSRGQERLSPASLAEDYVESRRRNAELHAQIELLENPGLRSAGRVVSADRILDDERDLSVGRKALTAAFDAAGEMLELKVSDCEQQQRAEVDQVAARWKSVRTKRNKAELQLAEVLASKHVTGQLATLLNLDNRVFWLAALVAFLVLAIVALHERRHEVRRMLHGSRARAMGASIVLQSLLLLTLLGTSLIFLFGDRIYDSLLQAGAGSESRTSSDMAEEVAQLRVENESLSSQIAGLLRQLDSATAYVLAAETSPSVPEATTWLELQGKLVSATIQASVKQQLAIGMASDLEHIRSLTSQHAENAASIRRYNLIKGGMKLLIGLVFLGAVGASGWLLMRGIHRRNETTAGTCPLCLGVGQFQVVSDGSLSRRASVDLLRCSNVVSEHPREECEFTFLSIYRDMAKLCFPTLGIAQAGKTHWLAMLYRELNRGNFSANVQFDKVKSRSSEEFDRIVGDILNSRLNPAGTQTSHLPHPLIFNFCDRDRLGRSNTLINIFDYSGEVTTHRSLDDPHRRRALDADGYLFFLDPTYLAEPQADALVNFREDVRAIRGVQTGQAIRSPVALCVPKIDLLTTQPYADPGGGGPIGSFYSSLREIDPTGTEFSLRVIQERSRLIQDLRDTIWPGWQIERQIHDLFGGRFMFFPLTPVGVSELGESDLHLRTIEPFAILEPLAWLLHMNGYPVLK